jgi:hypothetical protein
MFLTDGGNGVPFDFNSVLGGLSDFVGRVGSYLAVFTVCVVATFIFCVVFCVVDRVGYPWCF